jgi:biotin synthase
MPNRTPTEYRPLYEIYPAKACIRDSAEKCRHCMRGRIHSIGRCIAAGPGGRSR